MKEINFIHSFVLMARNAGERDLVWTFGGGPRVCIGKLLIEVILKVGVKPTNLIRHYTNASVYMSVCLCAGMVETVAFHSQMAADCRPGPNL